MHHLRVSSSTDSALAFFITEGGPTVGLGHVMRCIAVAQQVRAAGRIPIFIVNDDATVLRLLRRYQFDMRPLARAGPDHIWSAGSVENAPVLVDLKECSLNLVESLQRADCTVTVVDVFGAARLVADHVIYPTACRDYEQLDWRSKRGAVHGGVEYVPLKKEVTDVRAHSSCRRGPMTILLSFGGADPNSVTPMALRALNDVRCALHVKVRIGPTFGQRNRDAIRDAARSSDHEVHLYDDDAELALLVDDVALCMTAFGISVYEFNYLELPVLLIENYRTDAKAAVHLERLGMVRRLGCHEDIQPADISNSIYECVGGGAWRVARYVDGRGAERVGRLMVQ